MISPTVVPSCGTQPAVKELGVGNALPLGRYHGEPIGARLRRDVQDSLRGCVAMVHRLPPVLTDEAANMVSAEAHGLKVSAGLLDPGEDIGVASCVAFFVELDEGSGDPEQGH